MKKYVIIAVIFLLAIGFSRIYGFGKNKVKYNQFKWKTYKTEHFTIYYYPEEEDFLKIIGGYAEAAYDRISKTLRHDVKRSIPLIYYKTHGEFEQTNITLRMIGENVGGFSEPFGNRIVIPIDMPSEELRGLIAHELTHIFEFSILYGSEMGRVLRSKAPLWFMEGLSSHLARDESNIDKMIIRDAVVNDLIPPIQKLNTLNFMTYRYGQAACDFMQEYYGPHAIRDLLWEYRKNLSGTDENPIENAFATTIKKFNTAFKRFLKEEYYPSYLDKKIPIKHGEELTYKKNESFHLLSPVVSPTGELVAALSTENGMLDVVIISAKTGEKIRTLTSGYTGDYEHIVSESFSGFRDLSWSPNGDRVAFFVKEGKGRKLFVSNVTTGKFEKRIEIPVDQASSPSFSPDGKKVAFAGNKNGRVDIFSYDLESENITNFTRDKYFDVNPWWGNNGRIYYSRNVNDTYQIYSFDPQNPEEKKRITNNQSNNTSPYFHDGVLYFSSDREDDIYNIYSLNLDTQTLTKHTDTYGGAFSPVLLSEEKKGKKLTYMAFFEGEFKIFKVKESAPQEKKKLSHTEQERTEITAYDKEKFIEISDEQKETYMTDFIIESGGVNVGFTSDNTILSDSYLIISDMLGNHRFNIQIRSIRDYSNRFFRYMNYKHRTNFGVSVRDSRDYYYVNRRTGRFDRRVEEKITGASFIASYPFGKFHRIEAKTGFYSTTYQRPFLIQNNATGQTEHHFFKVQHDYPFLSASFHGDNVRHRRFGPFHGRRYKFKVNYAPAAISDASYDFSLFSPSVLPKEEDGGFTNYIMDFRNYTRLGNRSLLAIRLFGAVSEGNIQSLFYFGGGRTLRGYEYREFTGDRGGFMNIELRFPLVDYMIFPGKWGFRDIRGVIFWDVGGAYFENENYDFWDSENDKLKDGASTVGVGFNFNWGQFELHWDFGFRTDLSEIDKDARTTFWIGRKF